MSEPICYVMIGLPALGKSTHIEGMYKPDTWIYSTDMYIESVAEDHGLTYDDVFETNIQAATRFNEEKVATMMKLRKDIIWDQTNLGVGKRKKIINRMKQAGYQVRGICLMPPKTGEEVVEWNRRLANRPGKTIPKHVVANMLESFVEPTAEKGFDMITFYDMYGGLLAIDLCEDTNEIL